MLYREDYKEMKKIIKDIKKENFEQKVLINIFFNDVIKKVRSNEMIRDKMLDLKDSFNNNLNLEIKLLKQLKKYHKNLNCTELNHIIGKLDNINELSIEYYYRNCEDALTAFELNQPWRLNLRRDFKLLNEDEDLLKRIFTAIYSFENVLSDLNYGEEFNEYILNKANIILIDATDEQSEYFYGVYPLTDENDILYSMKIIMPEVVNMKTICITAHELKHAYDLYNMMGKEYCVDVEQFEKNAKKEEEKVKTKILTHDYQLWKVSNEI